MNARASGPTQRLVTDDSRRSKMNIRKLSAATAFAAILVAPLAFGQTDPKTDPNQLMAMEMAKKMDTNHDGMVSKEEFMKAMEQRWNEMDKEKKGMMTINQSSGLFIFFR
jgi:EF hand